MVLTKGSTNIANKGYGRYANLGKECQRLYASLCHAMATGALCCSRWPARFKNLAAELCKSSQMSTDIAWTIYTNMNVNLD